jgi:hypothetical protein
LLRVRLWRRGPVRSPRPKVRQPHGLARSTAEVETSPSRPQGYRLKQSPGCGFKRLGLTTKPFIFLSRMSEHVAIPHWSRFLLNHVTLQNALARVRAGAGRRGAGNHALARTKGLSLPRGIAGVSPAFSPAPVDGAGSERGVGRARSPLRRGSLPRCCSRAIRMNCRKLTSRLASFRRAVRCAAGATTRVYPASSCFDPFNFAEATTRTRGLFERRVHCLRCCSRQSMN